MVAEARMFPVGKITNFIFHHLPDMIEKPSYTIGDAGSQWRMTKLKRVMETAAEEGVPPEVIGLERYGVNIQDISKSHRFA